MSDVQTILELLAEGGGLVIYGAKKSGVWVFQLVTDDQTPTLVGDDASHQEQVWVKTLPEALDQIRWEWNCFSPLKVHTEFAAEIMKLKIEKDKSGKNSHVAHKWERLCGDAVTINKIDGDETSKAF